MALYAIGDLHLSFSGDKPMDIFGGEWVNHTQKLEKHWRGMIREEDTVLLLGDISWALKLETAQEDFTWLRRLPGRKIAIKGNHDLWWSTGKKLEEADSGLLFIHNDFLTYREYAICGSRGWVCPRDRYFTEHDQKIYRREVVRIGLSVEAAHKAGFEKKIVGMHFPPTNDRHEDSAFTECFEKNSVEIVAYGHLHGKDQYAAGPAGRRNGVTYHLASCDYLANKPLKLLD